MQPQTQFDRILEICKFFFSGITQELFNSGGNLSHCGRAPLCSDVEVIAISLFQEHCSIDSERCFFEELKAMLTEQYLKLGSRRNYDARKHRRVYHIEALRRKISERLIAAEPDNIKLIDSMPIEACRYSRAYKKF